MGKFIHLFNTEAEFEAKRETGYTEPWVSYTRETSAVTYNKDEYEKLLETPLTFEILSNGNITWEYQSIYGPDNVRTIYYSKNDGEWTELSVEVEEGPEDWAGSTTITVSQGDIVRFKGDNEQYNWDNGEVRNSFSESTCRFNIKGNIMSLINSTGFTTATTLTGDYNLASLFSNCTGLTSAKNLVLPATTLTEGCYSYMFTDCTSLTTAPSLPVTTLADNCYSSMFQGCTSLTSAPALPATTLAISCYNSMFQDCTGLITAPALPATTLTNYCYQGMFHSCTGLTSVPALPAITLASYCYQYMFEDCISLTSAPELPATTLTSYCYYQMFNGCKKLNRIKCLATDISAANCTTDWVSGVASSGTFVKDASMADWATGDNGIPTNWTVQNA